LREQAKREQVSCAEATEGYKTIYLMDGLPLSIRKRLCQSPFNICVACVEQRAYSLKRRNTNISLDQAFDRAISEMEQEIRREGGLQCQAVEPSSMITSAIDAIRFGATVLRASETIRAPTRAVLSAARTIAGASSMIDPLSCPSGTPVVCINNGEQPTRFGIVLCAEPSLVEGKTYIVKRYRDSLWIPGTKGKNILVEVEGEGTKPLYGYVVERFRKKELPEELTKLQHQSSEGLKEQQDVPCKPKIPLPATN
jgi:hypothetical protein